MRNLGHGRPSWELATNERQSDRSKDLAAWCMGICEQNAVSVSTWRVRSGSFHDAVCLISDAFFAFNAAILRAVATSLEFTTSNPEI